MSTLTRDAVNAVMAKHSDHWPADTEFSAADVRGYSRYMRAAAVDFPLITEAQSRALIAEADELDALADQYEREAA